jgi:hypothetical protein
MKNLLPLLCFSILSFSSSSFAESKQNNCHFSEKPEQLERCKTENSAVCFWEFIAAASEYDHGTKECSKNPEKAFTLFKILSDRGFLDGHYQTAISYATGLGVTRDIDRAELLFSKARENIKKATLVGLLMPGTCSGS